MAELRAGAEPGLHWLLRPLQEAGLYRGCGRDAHKDKTARQERFRVLQPEALSQFERSG